MAEEARRGLKWREEFGRGGTRVGAIRANQLANREPISAETVKRMASYFARHEVDKKGEGFSPGEKGFPSAGRIAWALWGGDAGQSWANKIAGQLKEDKFMDEPLMYRSVNLNREAVDEESRSIELSFSSESPVERAFGTEVLDHRADSIDLDRINSGAPLLLEHDRSQQIGVIERAWLDEENKKGRAVVRFSRSTLAEEIFQDVRDGIRSLVSVGYSVGRFAREKADEGLETFRAVSWTPLEVSLVSIPADSTVGVGRASELLPAPEPQEPLMEENKPKDQEVQERVQEVQPEVRIEVRPDKRAGEIAELGKRFGANDEAIEYISEGRSVDEFKNYLMERNANQPIEAAAQGDPEIGMSKNERKQYSLTRAILASADGKLDGIELEAHKELEKRFGREAHGFYAPNDVLGRDLTATGGDTGDKLVATVKPEMIEALKAQPVVAQLGARVLSGLTSNVTMPKAGTQTAYWTDENDSGSALSESTMTLGSISLSPKRVAAYSELSKQLLSQSSFDIEALVRDDLVYQLNLAFDKVAIDGGGTNEPSGILDASGIGSETGGQTWQNMLDAEADVMTAHALAGSLAYLTTPAVMATLKGTEKASNTGQFVWQDNRINGYTAVASTQCTADTTIFGDFSQVVLAEFGSGVDIVADPYTLALTGLIRVHAARLVDVGIRHDAAFSKIVA